MENMEFYNSWAECPANALKPIAAGKLKGKSDINPQWRIQELTRVFGPVGFGWRTQMVEHWVESAAGESTAWVRLNLYVKDPQTNVWSEAIEGIGGSKNNGSGMGDGINDEAFKMAETDAISVACKKLGMAANVYWSEGRTKYDLAAAKPVSNRGDRAKRETKAPAEQPGSVELHEAIGIDKDVLSKLVEMQATDVKCKDGSTPIEWLSNRKDSHWDDNKAFAFMEAVKAYKELNK